MDISGFTYASEEQASASAFFSVTLGESEFISQNPPPKIDSDTAEPGGDRRGETMNEEAKQLTTPFQFLSAKLVQGRDLKNTGKIW